MTRPIVFLSDFGLEDEFVGVCHGVLNRIAPDSKVIDLTHGVSPQDVLRGALMLAESIPYMPEDAVYLAIVDPGVGMARADLAVRTRSGNHLVGPDNGVLSLSWERLGGAERAVDIRSPEVTLPFVSSTFHGRDVFAPAAAHLATGMPIEAMGPRLDPGALVTVRVAEPHVRPGRVRAQVLDRDRFGNVQLNVRHRHLEAAALHRVRELELRISGRSRRLPRATAFGEVEEGNCAAIFDSRGWFALICNGGSAAEALGLAVGDGVVLLEPDAGG